jgi:hypothetical protein
MKMKLWIASLTGILAIGATATADDVRGIIQKIDTDKGEMVLEARGIGRRGLPMMFRLTKETKAVIGGQATELTGLSPGMRALVQYETRDGQRTATGITVRALLARIPGAATPGNEQGNERNDNATAGTIYRISFTEREIVVTSPGAPGTKPKETTFVIPENVSITKDKKAIKLDDVREGEPIVVYTQKRDGKTEVASVVIGEGAIPPAQASNAPRIERIRNVMRIADAILQQMEKRKTAPPPPPPESK